MSDNKIAYTSMKEENQMKRKIALLSVGLLIITSVLGFIAGCEDDPASSHGTAPEIPPQSTFIMEFSDFEQESMPNPTKQAMALTTANWTYAALNVGIWNTIITVGLAVPVAAFVAAFQHNAVWQPDNSWEWSYSFLAGGAMHTARLNGKVVEQQVQWKMYISRQDAFTDFLWYTGTADLAATEGQWILYDNPESETELLQIDWHRNIAEGTADIKYTNIVPDGAENGGYIFYGIVAGETYDRFYEIYNKGLDNITDIEWNYASKAGRVMDENHFGDTDWHCWDGTLSDITCP
jgi:hypothetical protein